MTTLTELFIEPLLPSGFLMLGLIMLSTYNESNFLTEFLLPNPIIGFCVFYFIFIFIHLSIYEKVYNKKEKKNTNG